MNISDKYPVISKGIIFRKNNDELIINYPSGTTEKISQSAFSVYQLCNGKLNVNEIINKLQEGFNFNSKELKKFMTKASNMGVLQLKGNKSYTKLNIREDTYLPLSVSFLPTTKCNLKCIYCFGSYNSQEYEIMPYPKVELLFKFLKSIYIKSIEITGGEPFTHPDFNKILKLALSSFSYTTILSNGTLLNDRILRLISDSKGKLGMQISIDGGTAETNDKVRGVKNSWPKTLNNIKQLIEIGIPLRIGYVITNNNYNELDIAVKEMRKLGVKNIMFSLSEGLGRGTNVTYPDKKPIAYLNSPYFEPIKEMLETVTKNNDDIVFSTKRIKNFENFVNELRNCGAGHKWITINPNGDFTGCPIMCDNSFVLGNIFNKSDIENYFNPTNEIFTFFRTFEKKNSDEKCKGCDYENYCGSCLFRIINANRERVIANKDICPFIKSLNNNHIFSQFLFTNH